MAEPFGVTIDSYCDQHYIKDFKKKYSDRRWELTEKSIREMAARPLQLAKETKRMSVVASNENMKICKGEFKVFGTDISAKASGNRFIVLFNTEKELVYVLLIYNKQDHVKGDHETDWWKNVVKEKFVEAEEVLG
jgi:hypothetical protein